MTAVTYALPNSFVRTPHTSSQRGTNQEQDNTLNASTMKRYEAYTLVQAEQIGIIEATVYKLMQEMKVFFERHDLAMEENDILSPDAIFVGRPLDTVSIRMLAHDVGPGKSIATFDIDDLCPDDIDELF